jgi:hypothetical protein
VIPLFCSVLFYSVLLLAIEVGGFSFATDDVRTKFESTILYLVLYHTKYVK